METDLIIEAAVIGVADELLGHKLVALITAKNGDCTDKLLMSKCAEKLPKYKLPSDVKFIRALPKSTIGKIDHAKCLALAKKSE